MSRTFKHRGFVEIRGADACVVEKEGILAIPPFTSTGALVIEGACALREEGQWWPDLICKLSGRKLGRISLRNGGAFRLEFDIGYARDASGMELQLSFDFERIGRFFSYIRSLDSTFRRRRRSMVKAEGRDVHFHRITLDGRLLADFTHGARIFLPDFSLSELGMGMNIIGFFEHEFGIGESARCCASAAKAAGIPITLNLSQVDTNSTTAGSVWSKSYRRDNPYPVNLFHLDSPQIRLVDSAYGPRFRAGHYNIGYWAWELPEYPDYGLWNMDFVDEVWVPSEFVRQSMAEKSPVPVLVMPHAVEFDAPANADRGQFGLPPGDFLFLVMYDINSSQLRKNPRAAIEAFRAAFPAPEGVKLVVKIHGAENNPEDFRALQESLGNSPDIILINRTLARGELRALQSLCDCFVSLHRAEGFGLALAECMYLGKPVIATNWSGNLEFMDKGNGCMVDYSLVEITESSGPYKKGQIWAEPDAAHAASWMKKVVEDAVFRREIAARGRERILRDFSRLKIGAHYAERLKALSGWL